MEKIKKNKPALKEIFGGKNKNMPESAAEKTDESDVGIELPSVKKIAAKKAVKKTITKKIVKKSMESAIEAMDDSIPFSLPADPAVEKKDGNIAGQKANATGEIAAEQEVPEKKNSKLLKITAIVFIAVMVIIALGAGAYYFYHQYKSKDNSVSVESSDNIVEKAGRLIELPDEVATLATVTDREKLKDQPFFAHSENGDKALIYTQAKKAILYRPSANKIIEVMYISIGQNSSSNVSESPDNSTQNQAQTQEQAQAQVPENNSAAQSQGIAEPASVAVYNGTNIKGLAAKAADEISSIEGVSILEKTNAAGSYEKTIVVNLTGKDVLAQKIADMLGAQVVKELPNGEKKPEADILIIGGGDFKI